MIIPNINNPNEAEAENMSSVDIIAKIVNEIAVP